MGNLKVLPSLVQNPYEAMALDEALLLDAIQNDPESAILRFYKFSQKCISIGLSQRNGDFLTLVHDMGLPWVRRPTGGGMVIHEKDLVISLVAPFSVTPSFSKAKTSYESIHDALRNVFQSYGIETTLNQGGCKVENVDPQLMICFERPICDDLMLGKRKVAGGAQRRSQGYLLHQGSIWLSAAKGNRLDDFEKSVADFLSQKYALNLIGSDLTQHQVDLALELKNNKYMTEDWNWKVRDHEKCGRNFTQAPEA